MGQLIRGEWVSDAQVIALEKGRYVRQPSQFKSFVSPDGSTEYRAERGRYHLYVSLQCPWAWRTVVYRSVKKLQDVISMSIAIPDGRKEGWIFGDRFPASTADSAEGFTHLYDAYRTARPDYTGVVSVPVLWDKQTRTIVNNESSDIIRMLNSAFDAFTDARQDYYPLSLQAEIDAKNERLYRGLNNGVYRAGVAKSQDAYEEAYHEIFATLDWAEEILATSRYLNGKSITESDWKLAASLFRFDPVYYSLFRCNKRQVSSYPNLSNYLRDIYQQPGVAETVNIRHIVTGYYSQSWNPSGIVPLGPEGVEAWLSLRHDRARFS